LRQPKTTPAVEKIAYAEEVLNLIGMDAFADTVIGASGESESSGFPIQPLLTGRQLSTASRGSGYRLELSLLPNPLTYFCSTNRLQDWTVKLPSPYVSFCARLDKKA
jgi:hypothetical protein